MMDDFSGAGTSYEREALELRQRQDLSEQEVSRFDEYLQTSELRDLLTMLEKGGYKPAELEAARSKVRVACHAVSHAGAMAPSPNA